MKFKTLVLISLILFSLSSLAQKIANVDFDEIKKATQNVESEYYYPKLIKRLDVGDTTLTKNHYAFIYYGQVFTEDYNPYGRSDDEDKFMSLYKEKKFDKAISYGEKVLFEEPVNLKICFKMLVCYHQLKDEVKKQYYRNRYFSFLDCIYESGDGASTETALVVISVDDEYEIMADLGVSLKSQSLEGDTDVIELNTSNQKRDKPIETLYFNVNKPLNKMAEMFKK